MTNTTVDPVRWALETRTLPLQLCFLDEASLLEYHGVAHQNGLTFIWSNPTVTGTQLERKRRPERPGEREDP